MWRKGNWKGYYLLLVTEKAQPLNIIHKWTGGDFNLSDIIWQNFSCYFILLRCRSNVMLKLSNIKCLAISSTLIKNCSKNDYRTAETTYALFVRPNQKLCTRGRLAATFDLAAFSGFYDRPTKEICQSFENRNERAHNAKIARGSRNISPRVLVCQHDKVTKPISTVVGSRIKRHGALP